MNVRQIFDELQKRAEVLDQRINSKVEGNSGDNAYTYNADDRRTMQLELAVVENTLAFLDEQIDLFGIK